MKSKKVIEIDPIKAKYIQDVGFFKKKLIKFYSFLNRIKLFRKSNGDYLAGESIVFDILLGGVLGNLALLIFGIKFGIFNILAVGSMLWLVENKVLEIFTKLLGSISLVKIYK